VTAELGQTGDPAQLVPGDVDAIHRTVHALTVYGDALHDAGHGLGRIDTAEGWSGPAADAFRVVFHGQPGKWLDAGDAFQEAAKAVERYAETLRWAQHQATDAISVWAQGQAATDAAKAAHATAVEHAQTMALAGAATPMPILPFADPGAAQRSAAQRTLDRARDQLAAAGSTAAGAVGDARDKAPEKPGFWSKVGHAFSKVGHDVADVGEHVVNGLASAGNAIVHHPGDVLMTAAGAGLTTISAAGEGAGTLLDVTGVGAVPGVALNTVSAAGIAGGVGMMGAGIGDIARHASGDDRVQVIQSNSSSAGGAGTDSPAPNEISGLTQHGEEQVLTRDGHGVSDEAMHDAVDHPVSPPIRQAGGNFKYMGKNATVVLTSDGRIVTAWARNSGGWRNP
jgi:hypothetical protein